MINFLFFDRTYCGEGTKRGPVWRNGNDKLLYTDRLGHGRDSLHWCLGTVSPSDTSRRVMFPFFSIVSHIY